MNPERALAPGREGGSVHSNADERSAEIHGAAGGSVRGEDLRAERHRPAFGQKEEVASRREPARRSALDRVAGHHDASPAPRGDAALRFRGDGDRSAGERGRLRALELHPAMENGALEAEPSAASHRAVALASPWICQTTSVAPVELVAPLNIRLPADPVKAPIAVVILEVPSAAKDCAISWPSPARTITALSGPA